MDSRPFKQPAADAKLSAQIAAFCGLLRSQYGFRIGVAESRDALCAVEAAGVGAQTRFRTALRAVLCGKREDLEPFDRAFEAFFLARTAAEKAVRRPVVVPRREPSGDELQHPSWEALIAKYSPSAGRGDPPSLLLDDIRTYVRLANDVIASVRRGRSSRWKPSHSGRRFDLRRTLRDSLRTAGEPLVLRRLAHPLRNPRFVLLVDGSRSMAPHAAELLTFAFALVRRTSRAHVFTFSTEIRDVTRSLRRGTLPKLDEAWGGGTRIGASLETFVKQRGALLGADTVVLVFSDGLDFGDPGVLASVAANVRRRSAALVWVSPNASQPGYMPATQGMRAVLPSLTALIGSRDLSALVRIGRTLSSTGLPPPS